MSPAPDPVGSTLGEDATEMDEKWIVNIAIIVVGPKPSLAFIGKGTSLFHACFDQFL